MTDTARVIRGFLEKPDDQRRWLDAWDLTVGQITTFLRAWESRGRRLPLSLFAGSNCHRDLAVVVVSEFFIRDRVSGVMPLVRFLRPCQSLADDAFVDQYITIIRKTARQNVHKLERENSPEAWNIRRNLRRTLRDSHGEFIDQSRGRYLEWAWSKSRSPQRLPMPCVDDTTLHTWVTSACREAPNTPSQCRHVFASLDGDDRFRNTLSYYQLVKTFVVVQLNHELPQEFVPESPLLARIRGMILVTAPAAAEETLNHDLPHLIKLAGIESHEKDGIIKAFHAWLADWVEHFDNDSLREYLCEQLGDIPLPVYQKRYHYVWNTLTGKCKDRILKRVRGQLGIDHD